MSNKTWLIFKSFSPLVINIQRNGWNAWFHWKSSVTDCDEDHNRMITKWGQEVEVEVSTQTGYHGLAHTKKHRKFQRLCWLTVTHDPGWCSDQRHRCCTWSLIGQLSLPDSHCSSLPFIFSHNDQSSQIKSGLNLSVISFSSLKQKLESLHRDGLCALCCVTFHIFKVCERRKTENTTIKVPCSPHCAHRLCREVCNKLRRAIQRDW